VQDSITNKEADFRPSNILVKLRNLDHLTKHAILTVLGGEPVTVDVCGNEGADVPPSVPKYLVHEVNFQEVDFKYLSDEICLIDYGVSFHKEDPPSNYYIPLPYLPPEGFALSDDNETYPPIDSVGGDMWALGCTLFEIRMQVELFYMLEGRDEHLDEMVRLFGKLPQALWDSWTYRDEYYDDDANPVGYRAGEDISQYFEKVAMNQPLSVTLHHADGTEEEKHFEMCEKEKRLFADLLRRILRYDPAERASMNEILEHDWFKM
jgi:serine/threonine-protein kinase SRPK3